MALRSIGGITRGQAAALQVTTRAGGGGRWCTFNHQGQAIPAADTLYFYWFPQFEDVPITLLRTRCVTGGAGSAVKFGLWRNDPATGRPTGLPVIGQNAGLSTAGTNTWQDSSVASVRMGSPTGWWFGSKFTGTLPTMIVDLSTGAAVAGLVWPVGSMPTAPRNHLSIADAYANDILAFNATGQPLVETSAVVAAFAVEWA